MIKALFFQDLDMYNLPKWLMIILVVNVWLNFINVVLQIIL